VEHTLELMDRFRQDARPFFLWHNFWGPHAPYFATTEYLGMYRNIEIPQWSNFDWPSARIQGPHRMRCAPGANTVPWEAWAETLRYYYAFTSMIDDQIGRLLAWMDSRGMLENTVVIFAADHGETCGSHGGLADKGFTHFDEVLRIPLLIRFPDGKGAGTVQSELVSSADIHPTICDVAGASCGGGELHGRSLLELLDGEGEAWRDSVVSEFGGLGSVCVTQRSIRWKDLKYGLNAGCRDEFYDLARDPDETENHVDDPEYAVRLAEIRNRLREWMRETGDRVQGAMR
jgi:arylsulfatase A-like enzyme